jgi:hypothetical protein
MFMPQAGIHLFYYKLFMLKKFVVAKLEYGSQIVCFIPRVSFHRTQLTYSAVAYIVLYNISLTEITQSTKCFFEGKKFYANNYVHHRHPP